MKLEQLKAAHVEDAAQLVLSAYLDERRAVGILPLYDDYRESLAARIAGIAGDASGLPGVAAVEGGKLIGFLAGYPVEQFFSSNDGVYVPLYGHGAAGQDRRLVYQRLYAEASGLWVGERRLTHCVSMFAHDALAVDAWFWLGFGLRCVDAIRPLVNVEGAASQPELEIRKAEPADAGALFALHTEHCGYYQKPPLFMPSVSLEDGLEDFRQWLAGAGNHLWAAYLDGEAVSYMRIRRGGETFVSDDPKMYNVSAAYTTEAARGTGAGAKLLQAIVDWVRGQGCVRLGTDYESFNNFGSRFWQKHFTPFMLSSVRCIDDRIAGSR